MRIREAKLEAINERYSQIRKEKRIGCVSGKMGLDIKDGIWGATIFSNNWAVCSFEELGALIDELTDMKRAIEEETGLY